MKTFPMLYHKGRSGALYQWEVWAEGNGVFTRYGQVGGQLQTSHTKAMPKNEGKINATNPEVQAAKEAAAMHKFKLDRKYSLTPAEAQEELELPMLAQDFEKRKTKVHYPVILQPKLDGNRCMAVKEGNKFKLYSRAGKEFNLPHIDQELNSVAGYFTEGAVLDGELYIHGMSLQTIVSFVKKYHKGETEKVQFWVYDFIRDRVLDYKQTDREAYREQLFKDNQFKTLVFVPSCKCNNEAEVYDKQGEFIGQGFEGAIVRTLDNFYEFGYRSPGLLKVKTFQDAEFPIVGFTHGEGKMEKAVIFTCSLPNKGTFDVIPKATMEERERLYIEAPKLIGKMYKVKFFKYTDKGVPFWPVGLGVREEWDR